MKILRLEYNCIHSSTNRKMVPPKKNNEKIDRSHIIVVSRNPETYKCNICEKIFRNKKSKCYHDSCVTGIHPYKCNVCEQTFVKRSHYEYHERMHTGYKPFQCTLCDKAFPQKNKLNRHMLSHKQEKPFSCLKCDKCYAKRDDLMNHMSLHNGETPHVCKICSKAFRIMTNLNRHMRTHSSDRPYTCELCSKSFKDKSLLSRHRRTHGNEKPFSCAHCNRLFLSKSELCRHLAIHTDVKPFACTYCDTPFRRKDNLNRHIRHHHADDNCADKSQPEKEKISMKLQKKSVLTSETSVANSSKNSDSMTTKKNRGKKSSSVSSISSTNNSSNSLSKPRGILRDEIPARMDLPVNNIMPIIRMPGELSNAVPVINGPRGSTVLRSEVKNRLRTNFTYTEPIPLAEAVVINQRIEEKLYPQSSKSTNNYYFFRNHSSVNDVGTNNNSSINLNSQKSTIIHCNRINISTNLVKRNLSTLSQSISCKNTKIESRFRTKHFDGKFNIADGKNDEKIKDIRKNDIIVDNESTTFSRENGNRNSAVTINDVDRSQ